MANVGITNSSFYWFVAFSLFLFGACYGFDKESAERGMIQTNLNRLPVKFRFRANHDPAHGGLSQEFSLERTKGKFLMICQETRHFPQSGERNFKPRTAEKKEERALDEAEQFLHILVHDLKIEEIGNLKARFLLHPRYYDFEIRYADGHVHRFEYVIEASHHRDDRYSRLVDECEKFFEIK